MTDTTPIDIATPPPERRRLPLWLWWIVGLMAAITAVAVVWTLQRPARPMLDAGWTPLCPRMEGEWVRTWDGIPGKISVSKPTVIGDQMFQETFTWGANESQTDIATQEAMGRELRDLSGNVLISWKGKVSLEYALIEEQIVALELGNPDPLLRVKHLTQVEKPIRELRLLSLLEPKYKASNYSHWRILPLDSYLVLVGHAVEADPQAEAQIVMLDPASLTITRQLPWEEKRFRAIESDQYSPDSVFFIEADPLLRTLMWDLEANTWTYGDPARTFVLQHASWKLDAPEVGKVASWPVSGSQLSPTYVGSTQPGIAWDRLALEEAWSKPDIGIAIEVWARSDLGDIIHVARQSHPAVFRSVAELADFIDDAAGGRDWHHLEAKLGGGWLLYPTPQGVQQTPIDRNVLAPIESCLLGRRGMGINFVRSDTGALFVVQEVVPPTFVTDAPFGLLRLGVLDESIPGFTWYGYLPLPQQAVDEQMYTQISIIQGKSRDWISLLYREQKPEDCSYFVMEIPPLEEIVSDAMPQTESSLVQNNPGH